ncbi:MAG: hypothetical protein KDC49_12060 [Saprospiraceae bacterium]|nr:hypothetical protein [Saprospiraceae bacterium]
MIGNKKSGISLLLGAFLMTVTMVLHPAGGDNAHIVKMASMFMLAHGIAIFAVPFTAYGFFGLSQKWAKNSQWSYLAFGFAALSLIAAVFAAMINGVILPNFLKAGVEKGFSEETIQAFRTFIFRFNAACDYVLMGGLIIAIFIWSLPLLRSESKDKWLAYFGLILVIICLVFIVSGFNFLSVFGFRVFVFLVVIWIFAAGWRLVKG